MHSRTDKSGLVKLTALTLAGFALLFLLTGVFFRDPPTVDTAAPSPSPTATATPIPSSTPTLPPSPTPLPTAFAPVTLSHPATAPPGYGCVREETLTPTGDFVSGDGLLSVADGSFSSLSLDITALLSRVSFPGGTPTVLIYHTHGSEGYETGDDGLFLSQKDGNAEAPVHSVSAVVDALSTHLQSLGVNVLTIDRTFDVPSRSGSFKRSRAAVEEILSQTERVDLVIDLHRGILSGSDGSRVKPTLLAGDQKVAQITLLACCDPGRTLCPDWEDRLAVSLLVQRELRKMSPLLCLPVALEQQVYNLNLPVPCLMAEIGTDVNTADEANRSAAYLAEAIATVLKKNTVPST